MASLPFPDLFKVLVRLGLTEYFETLTRHGFHNWETVLDIAEDDFARLGFKLGHRRALQREIATFRGLPPSESLQTPNGPGGSSTAFVLEGLLSQRTSTTPTPREKRRYRRHARPDANAPKRPKTAYVNFADQLRMDPEIRSLSFVDIAREVGRRWQTLSAEKKRIWESDAARAMQEYEAQVDDYKKTASWRNYQSYFRDFKARHGQPAKTKRSTCSRVDSTGRTESSRASPSPSDNSTPVPFSATPEVDAELVHNSLTLAFSELVDLRNEILTHGAQVYDEHFLPPEECVGRAMHAFVQGTECLVYTWTHRQVDKILDRMYRPSVPIDAMTLAECFTLAALGAHYDRRSCPDHLRRLLYASCTLQFNDRSARVDYQRTARLLLSMSLYALLDKHMGARYITAAGLQICRWRCPPRQHPGHEQWRRLFQSLIFMESWLSFTLGYPSEVKGEDVAISCVPNCLDLPTIEEMIHTQNCQLELIAAEISKTFDSPILPTVDIVTMLGRKLEDWRAAVPLQLQLDNLMQVDSNPPHLTHFQSRAALMTHILYLEALILLYRQFLVAKTGSPLLGAATKCKDVPSNLKYINECGVAGRQIARILPLMDFESTLCKTCWILVHSAFTASIVLLFVATIKILDGHVHEVESELLCADSCLELLRICADSDHLAKRYLDIVTPLYNSLRDIHQRMVGRAKTSIYMLVEAEPSQTRRPISVSMEKIEPTLVIICELLTDPFGRMQSRLGHTEGRRILNADGSYSVFWWR